MAKFDFSGWATRNDLQCADGRVIRRDAFKQQDGETVSLVWNHQHNSPDNVLGHALLENREEGVYAYCTFNDTESGNKARKIVRHGDVVSLSIWANQLKQMGKDVVHGTIRELSLVLAGANPGAFIDTVMSHGADSDDEMIIGYNENIMLYGDDTVSHSDEKKKECEPEDKKEDQKQDQKQEPESKKEEKSEDEETLQDVFDSMTEKQQNVCLAMISQALGEKEDSKKDDEPDDEDNDSKGGEKTMKHNAFDKDQAKETFLSHSVQAEIINLAKSNSVGSLRDAIAIYLENNSDTLAHGIEDIEKLFPDYQDVRPGAPERITRDQGWVTAVLNKANKVPFSRIRTKQTDSRIDSRKGRGYKKGELKKENGDMKLYNRTTDPQTVYVKDKLNRDDIVDITDFEVSNYLYVDLREKLNEEVATAVMIGDGREAGDENKIDETHIRPIWTDEEFFTMHVDVDIEGAKKEIQGTNTSANFGEDYVYAEAIMRSALFAREKYKGTGQPDFYCTPHIKNVMLLARDLNGRRIYDTVDDIAKALDVGAIHTAEQFENLERTTGDNKTKNLLGLFVNMVDYTIGATKGGEITKFEQFDIDFNQMKYLLETRLSGALTRYHSAIALEEDITAPAVSG